MRLLPVQFRPTPLLEAASAVIRTLKGAGFDSGIVGGGVRDSLLGRPLSDCDIVTAARPEELAKLFPGSRLVGASFGVSLVRHGGFEFEVAAARQERFYLDGRHPGEVRYTRDLAVDMQRRDFTVNALWYDPVTEIVHDAVGGIDDLERGVLRTVGEPEERKIICGCSGPCASFRVSGSGWTRRPNAQSAVSPRSAANSPGSGCAANSLRC